MCLQVSVHFGTLSLSSLNLLPKGWLSCGLLLKVTKCWSSLPLVPERHHLSSCCFRVYLGLSADARPILAFQGSGVSRPKDVLLVLPQLACLAWCGLKRDIGTAKEDFYLGDLMFLEPQKRLRFNTFWEYHCIGLHKKRLVWQIHSDSEELIPARTSLLNMWFPMFGPLILTKRFTFCCPEPTP